MTEYDSVPALRAALTSDNPDIRSQAYGAVLTEDIEPTAVLADDPPTEELVAAGIVPERATDEEHDTYGVLVEIRDLLAAIEENTGGTA